MHTNSFLKWEETSERNHFCFSWAPELYFIARTVLAAIVLNSAKTRRHFEWWIPSMSTSISLRSQNYISQNMSEWPRSFEKYYVIQTAKKVPNRFLFETAYIKGTNFWSIDKQHVELWEVKRIPKFVLTSYLYFSCNHQNSFCFRCKQKETLFD